MSTPTDLERVLQRALFLESIVEFIPDMVFVKDAEQLRFVLVNRAAETLIGRARESVIGRNDDDLFRPEEAAFFTGKDREVLSGRVGVDIPEEPIHTAHGMRWLHTKKIPIAGPDGTPRFLLGISQDITERKRTEDALHQSTQELARANAELVSVQADLRASEGRLRMLVEHFPGASWTTDAAGTVTTVAGARVDALGLREGVGRPLRDAFDEEVVAAHRAALSGQPGTCEVVRDGRTYELRVEALEAGTIAVALDVTERRRLETERLQARLRDAQRLESLGLLAGGIAHDFNNLLQVMLGHAGLARMSLDAGHPVLTNLGRIEASAARAGELTRQLLAYAGKASGVAAIVDLSAMVHDMGQLLRVTVSKQVQFVRELESDLFVEGDVTQLRQVVLNLITNASEAIGDRRGEIRLLTRRTPAPDGAHGSWVELRVTDTGRGMDAATQQVIFDPFFTTKERGHGLGLSATLGIVRAHRGRIAVSSTPDVGTTVSVVLPMSSEVPGATDAGTPATVDAGYGTILVVDDEDMVREFAVRALQRGGYTVVAADDGEQAVATFQTRPFDAVLLDVTMPGMNGYEALDAIRALHPTVPVLLTSGFDEQAATRSSRASGFLPKPYTPEELLHTLRAVLGRGADSWEGEAPGRG